MNGRDLEYVWNRLASPCTDALDAHERLQKAGYGVEAGELMVAMQTFTDECRRIRKQVSRRNAGDVTVDELVERSHRNLERMIGHVNLEPGEYRVKVVDDIVLVEPA